MEPVNHSHQERRREAPPVKIGKKNAVDTRASNPQLACAPKTCDNISVSSNSLLGKGKNRSCVSCGLRIRRRPSGGNSKEK